MLELKTFFLWIFDLTLPRNDEKNLIYGKWIICCTFIALYYIILFTKKRSKINKQSLFGMKLKKLKRMKHLFTLTSSKHNWFSTFNNKSIFKLQKVISAIKLRCLQKTK